MLKPILSVLSLTSLGFFTIAPVLDHSYLPNLESQNKFNELYSLSQQDGWIFQNYAESTDDAGDVTRGDGRKGS